MGLVLMLVSFVLDVAFLETDPSIAEANMTLKWFYRFSPGFCLGNGLLTMAFSSLGIKLGGGGKRTLVTSFRMHFPVFLRPFGSASSGARRSQQASASPSARTTRPPGMRPAATSSSSSCRPRCTGA